MDPPWLSERYEPRQLLGRGAFGLVTSARDRRTGVSVAVKTVPDAGVAEPRRGQWRKAFLNEKLKGALSPAEEETGNRHPGDEALSGAETRRARTAVLREMQLMRHFNGHENITTLRDMLPPPCGTPAGWRDVHLVLDLMDSDLHSIVHSRQPLSDDHVRFFVYQMLRGLKAIHSAQVLHRDLKPSNLLVNRDCELRISDFGLARGVPDAAAAARPQHLTEYVVTRWYRAPELLAGCDDYGSPVDVWSVGCILAEMLGRAILFPGRDVLHQLRLIVRRIRVPESEEGLGFIGNPKAVEFIRAAAAAAPPPPPLASLYPRAPAEAVDLLERMLAFEPSRRISAAEALRHPYLSAYHALNEEPDAPPFDFGLSSAFAEEGGGPSDAELQALLWDQLRHFHPELPPLVSPPPATPAKAAAPAEKPETPGRAPGSKSPKSAAHMPTLVAALNHADERGDHATAGLAEPEQSPRSAKRGAGELAEAAQALADGAARRRTD